MDVNSGSPKSRISKSVTLTALATCCGFFLPVRVLSRLFRSKFLLSLRTAFAKGALRLAGELHHLSEPPAFHAWCRQAARLEWVVYAKPPFGGPRPVLKYLARYTHCVAISNHRIRDLENGRVSFDWKDYTTAEPRV